MATVKEAQAVKTLNTTPGRRNRRFVFKSFAQQIEELEIDVFRSLDPLKAEPSSGSSFFLDCLTQWRELNTAEDFISFYDENIPIVQTLPLIILHKDTIISRLLSRLKLSARLSLEPILRLLAELSRDLLEDFLPFLPRIVESYWNLLKDGADREPEIIEQIFGSVSYMMMYLQKYLTRDIVSALKLTFKLRYYPKDFVQEFVAEALSFLLRNAPDEQLKKGIRKILCEAARKPSQTRKSGVSALLWHVMRGTSSRFHSKAERVLQLLTNERTLSIGDRFTQGSDVVTDIVTTSFERSCLELNPVELKLMWDCLYKKIDHCTRDKSLLHLSRLLSVLISIISVDRGRKLNDYKPLKELVESLVRAFVIPSNVVETETYGVEVIDKILQLMLCVIDGIHSSNDFVAIPAIASQWAPAFQLKRSSVSAFLKVLLQKDYALLAFRENILSALLNLLEMSKGEGVYLTLTFFERLRDKSGTFNALEGVSEDLIIKMGSFFRKEICNVLDGMKHGGLSSSQMDEGEIALVWGIICCIPHVLSTEASSYLMKMVDMLDEHLATGADDVAGLPAQAWQSLIGASISSYLKAGGDKGTEVECTSTLLRLARTYKSSRPILSSVADYLDCTYGSLPRVNSSSTRAHPDLEAAKVADALTIFSENLFNSDKGIRVSTLRILCHYEHLTCESSRSKHLVEQNMDTMATESSQADIEFCNVWKLFLEIEETPASVSTSRKLTLLVSKVQSSILTARVPEAYILPSFYGIIGVLYNQFRDLSTSALECLSAMIRTYPGLLWDHFVSYFEDCQTNFLRLHQLDVVTVTESLTEPNDLLGRFHLFSGKTSFDNSCTVILSLLLRALQKIPAVAESHTRQMVPLFLKFMGYNDEILRVESFDSHICGGKDWKINLTEWLNLLKLMKNSRSFYRGQLLKEVLLNRLLEDDDSDAQLTVLDCLLNWRDDFLNPYEKHLKNLICSKYLREELATWSLSKESNMIEEEHRAQLVPVVIRLLMPKVRNLRTLASRKHASVSNRKAVLGFIAQLNVDELHLFFELLMKSLKLTECASNDVEMLIGPQVGDNLDSIQLSSFLDIFTRENLLALPWKKKNGFLHVVEEVFGVFAASHVRPFLNLLIGCVARVLDSCASSIDNRGNEKSADLTYPSSENTEVEDQTHSLTSVKQLKDMRSLCLKIISVVLDKYGDHDFGSVFWDLFFSSIKPLICGFKLEGASSEKPSSLFFCFLAMSQSRNLVSLLCREKNLIPDIFSILSVPTASEAIVASVFKFVENLLTIELEHGSDKNEVREVLVVNLESLLDNLHNYFHSSPDKKRRLLKHSGEILLRLFRLLSKFMKDQSIAKKFVDILVLIACDGVEDSDVCMEALQILRDVVPFSGRESTTKILDSLPPILISAAQLEIRLSICDLLDALAESDPSLRSMAELIRELNATSAMEVDFDYTCTEINVEFFKDRKENEALVVLSQCIYDMISEELGPRQNAYRSLLSFVRFAALVMGNKEKNQLIDNCYWTDAVIQRIVNKFLLKHMADAMSKATAMRKEWIELLREMVLELSEVSHLRAVKALCSTDEEVDFFRNIVHLQIHRRVRALARFGNTLGTEKLPEFTFKTVFIPLFFSILFDVQNTKREGLKNGCLDALASIAGQLGWKSYYGLLLRCFKEMGKRRDREKVLLRLICSILDQFHFSESCLRDDALIHKDELTEPERLQATQLVVSTKCAYSNFSEIQSCLARTVLPKLQRLLVSDSEKVNVNVSLAMLKLLKILPGDTLESHLSSIIRRISNFLKHRLESIRDEARSALSVCLKELGFEYLPFIIKALTATLKRGFELHVLGYSLHFILSKGLSFAGDSKLDCCMTELLSVVDNDIFGEVAEQKDVEKIASKMKENRKQMSFNTLKLIAQNVTFKTHGLKLLTPVTARLHKHLTPKVKQKLETMLNHVAEGIEKNPSVNQTDLFIFIYSLIDDWISEESHKDDNSSVDKSVKKKLIQQSGKKLMKCNSRGAPLHSHLITVFALGLLHNRLRSMKLNKRNGELLSMLDPFVKLLTACLSSKYEEVVSIALKCILPLIRLPLPSLESQADKIKVTVLDIAQRSFDANSPVTQSCLKLLTALLRATSITLSTEQLQLLIQFPVFVDLEKNASFVALTLLKAIVRRRLEAHEIYDVATQVAELMVVSQDEAVRRRCSQILLQFLMNYKMTQKRRQQHIDYLVANLRYEHATGRAAVLEMLRTIIKRFPDSVINDQSETLFVHLVVALANDCDNHVRSLIGLVIKQLISRISPQSLRSILQYCLAWYVGEKEDLWGPAAQVLGFVVEVMKKGFQNHSGIVLPVIRKIMQSSVALLNGQIGTLDQGTIPYWKETYYSLVLLEKILLHIPELLTGGNQICRETLQSSDGTETDASSQKSGTSAITDIWEALSELLVHPHPWICNISNRLVALYFEQMGKQGKKIGLTCLTSISRLFLIATSLCCLLKLQLPDKGARKAVKWNIAFSMCGLQSLLRQTEYKNPHSFWSSLAPHEQKCFVKACRLLDAKSGRSIEMLFAYGVEQDVEKTDHEDISFILVSDLLKRMGKTALQSEEVQSKTIMGSFKLIASQMNQEDCHQHAIQLLLPVYKLCEGFSGNVVSDDLKQYAEKVRLKIKAALGDEKFKEAYNHVKHHLGEKRHKRKREEKVMAVVDPVWNAKRKMRLSSKHQAHKKRKMMTMKMGRWSR